MTKKRYLQDWIVNDLQDKMVFVSGPRQVGKTTLSQWIGETEYKPSEYLNWDDPEQRRRILDYRFQANSKLIIFDELHKYPLWRQYLKGLYDTHKARFKIIVTGSARLDIYRRAGESLLGRYHAYRLHPFSLPKCHTRRNQHVRWPRSHHVSGHVPFGVDIISRSRTKLHRNCGRGRIYCPVLSVC